MPLPWLAAGIGAGLGLLKQQGAKRREKQQRKEAAEIIRYSPWTGMTPNQIQPATGMLEGIVGGGAQGALIGSMLPAAKGVDKVVEGAVSEGALQSASTGALGAGTQAATQAPGLGAGALGGAQPAAAGTNYLGAGTFAPSSVVAPNMAIGQPQLSPWARHYDKMQAQTGGGNPWSTL